MELLQIVLGLILIVIGLVLSLILFMVWSFTKLFDSIQPYELSADSATSQAIPSGSKEPNPLFRYFPHLRKKIAWEELGVYPTPIHSAYLDLNGRRISFWMKREDLSSPIYGGNKVRTLQYQIPACAARVAEDPGAQIFVVGSGGSNQVVATLAHGTPFDLKFHVAYAAPDAPDLDNTLNLLSALSLGPLSLKLWDKVLPQVKRLVMAATSKRDKVFGMGGNSLGGILGQIGGALELAEQIEAGEIPDVDEIYLPLGSGCTTTGLILGVCLARHLNLKAFRSKNFKIVSILIHGGFAGLNRKTNFIKGWMGKFLFVSPQFGIPRTAAFLKKHTGIDLEASALKFVQEEWEVVDCPDYIGEYGAHSEKSATASAHDHKLVVNGPCPSWISSESPPQPWLCGHFTGKSFAVMLDRLEKLSEGSEINALLWQTKSNVQPLGPQEEWEEFQKLAGNSKILKKWSDEGKATSVLRPGQVNVEGGNTGDYRPLMKKIF